MKNTHFILPFAFLVSLGAALPVDDVAAKDSRYSFNSKRVQQVPSWYLALSGSLNFMSDVDVEQNASGTRSTGSYEMDDGMGFTGAIGYRPRYTGSLFDNLRFELEAGRISNDVTSVTSTSGALTAVSGDLQSTRAMANLYIDVDIFNGFRPYIGAGAGAVNVKASGQDDTVFGYQGMAGLYYMPESFPQVDLGFGYRYLSAPDVSLGGAAGSSVGFDYEVQSIEAGLRAYF